MRTKASTACWRSSAVKALLTAILFCACSWYDRNAEQNTASRVCNAIKDALIEVEGSVSFSKGIRDEHSMDPAQQAAFVFISG